MFDWLPWLAGGSTIALLAVAILAPSVLTVAASWLSAMSPLVTAMSHGIVTAWNILWIGFKDIVDNWKTVVTTIVIVLVSLWYFKPAVTPCPVCPVVVCEKGKPVVKSNRSNIPTAKSDEDVLTTMRRAFGL
jgi:hypothetical protein